MQATSEEEIREAFRVFDKVRILPSRSADPDSHFTRSVRKIDEKKKKKLI